MGEPWANDSRFAACGFRPLARSPYPSKVTSTHLQPEGSGRHYAGIPEIPDEVARILAVLPSASIVVDLDGQVDEPFRDVLGFSFSHWRNQKALVLMISVCVIVMTMADVLIVMTRRSYGCFGVVGADGALDRVAMRARVFGDDEARRRHLLHDAVGAVASLMGECGERDGEGE